MKALLRIAAVAAVVAGFGNAPAVAIEPPVGDCPATPNGGQPVPIYIADLEQSGDKLLQAWAGVLRVWDQNLDGYACAGVRCTPCPPTAQRCNIHCQFVGPLADNDVYP